MANIKEWFPCEVHGFKYQLRIDQETGAILECQQFCFKEQRHFDVTPEVLASHQWIERARWIMRRKRERGL